MIRILSGILLLLQLSSIGLPTLSGAAQTPLPVDCLLRLPSRTPDALPTPDDTVVASSYDLMFIDAMLDRGTITLGLANQALQQTNTSAVWRIALRIAESQAGALQLLRGWRQTWYPAAPPWHPRTDSATPIAILETCTPTEIDQQFLRVMTSHLQSVVEFATAAQPSIEHPELQDFANSIAESEDREIRSMQTLLNSISSPLPD